MDDSQDAAVILNKYPRQISMLSAGRKGKSNQWLWRSLAVRRWAIRGQPSLRSPVFSRMAATFKKKYPLGRDDEKTVDQEIAAHSLTKDLP